MHIDELIKEFRGALLKAENPLIMFDNDIDGLVSFLLLRKHFKKGRPFIVKSSPTVTEGFADKIKMYHADAIFILDKPLVEQEFIDAVHLPVYWIDHHPAQTDRKGVHYLNPRLFDEKDTRPTSYWCYQITQEHEWLALCGIIGDWHLPPGLDKFRKKYPGYLGKSKNPGKILFTTKLGNLVKMMSFLLKGKDSDIAVNVKVLEKIQEPEELLEGTSKEGRFLLQYFNKMHKHYLELLEDALACANRSKFLVFAYRDVQHSFTGYLANELIAKFPKKIILVGRQKDGVMIMSLRSGTVNLLSAINKIIPDFNGYGGGHDFACACKIPSEDFPRFLEAFKKELKKVNA